MSIQAVRAYFQSHGLEDRIREFDVSSATVPLAAQALGVPEARIAKTLSFRLNGGAMLLVAAGDARIDNPKYKARFGTKAKMLTAEEAVEETGHAVGGVCPFVVKPGVSIYLDESLRRFDTIYPAAGSASSAVQLSPEELERLSQADGWVEVCKTV